MAMDFWEAQRRARKRTTLCLIVFCLLTIGMACLAEYLMRVFVHQDGYDPPFPYIAIAFMGITFCLSFFQYSMFRTQGGSYVAESVGAYRVDPRRASPKEQQLLNIVEEMAVAASVPVPAVYILEAPAINAFAAGLTPENAAITVTTGCLALLNRDELQGVVAHEFGHIYNADMTISLRLAAMVMGFFFVLYMAMRLLQIASFQGRGDDRKGPNPLMIAALVLLVAGAFTWFAGSILKCMVSRQREYLADACAVQFTRNPNGIANALRKIGGEKTHDMPKTGMAYSHMYFDDASFMSQIFATHPPLKKRIAAIEGGTYLSEEEKE